MDAQNRHQRHFHVDRDWKYPCIAEVCSEAIGGGDLKSFLEFLYRQAPENPMPEFSGLGHALGRGESASRGDGSLLL